MLNLVIQINIESFPKGQIKYKWAEGREMGMRQRKFPGESHGGH